MAMKFWTDRFGFFENTTMQDRTKVLSERYNCKIDFYEKNKPFMIVDQKIVDDFTFIKIIYEEKMGWMTWQNWLNFERLI